jgi:hypothetical protein
VHVAHHGCDLTGRRTEPVGEDRTVDLDPLALKDLRLAVEREVIRIPRHQDVGDHRFRQHAALD